jgi:hypothetical protein
MSTAVKELVKTAKNSGNGNGKDKPEMTIVKDEKIQANQKEENQTANLVVPESKPQDSQEPVKNAELDRVKELEARLQEVENRNKELQEKAEKEPEPKKITLQELQERIETVVTNGKLLEKLVSKRELFKRRLFEVREFVFGSGASNGSLTLKDDHNRDINTTDNRFLKAAHQAILREAEIMLCEIEKEISEFMVKI